jgi:Tat protein translocase TatB subunit
MFGMSMTELMIIAVIALILIGPDELPKAARTIGKTLRDIQKAGDELRDTFEREVMTEVKKPTEPPPGAVAKPRTLGNTVRELQRDLQKAGENFQKEVMGEEKAPPANAPLVPQENRAPAPNEAPAPDAADPNGKTKGAA